MYNNMIKIKFIIYFLLFLISQILYGSTFFVSKSGNDVNPGTEKEPWLTVQFAVDNVIAGDTVLVKEGIYNELITFNNSGSEINGYIVLINYPGTNPIIDGTNLSGSSSWPVGLVRIINKNYIKIIGFELRNLITSNSSQFPAGIWIRGTSHHIEIKDNTVHHIEQNANNAGAHGIAVYGTNGSSSVNNIIIDDNEVRDCILGWSESLVLNGNVENFTVSNNIVHDNNNIAYDFIGYEGECPNPQFDQARNGVVLGNIAYNIDSRGNPAYGNDASADGFYVDGGRDIIIERNEAYDCNIGIELASEHKGKSTNGVILRNNYVHHNTVVGIAIGGYDQNRGTTADCKIVNNTLYKNNTENFDWGAEILLQYYCENNLFNNNIVFSNSNLPIIDHSTSTGSNNIFNYNLYYTNSNAIWYWGTHNYNAFNDFQNSSGQDSNSFFEDPLFINPINRNPGLKSNSVAIDKGYSLSQDIIGLKDYFGNDRLKNGIVDIGAVEIDLKTTSVDNVKNLPYKFELLQNFPNPFNPSTTISFVIPQIDASSYQGSQLNNLITLKLYDTLGRTVAILLNKNLSGGIYNVDFDASSLSSGVYFYQLTVGKKSEIKKMVLSK